MVIAVVVILGGLLLASGVAFMLYTSIHDGPVLEAARAGNVKSLKRALNEGGSVNAGAGDDASVPAISLAIDLGSYESVELLLRHGADPNPDFGTSPLMAAREIKRLDLVNLLLRYGAK